MKSKIEKILRDNSLETTNKDNMLYLIEPRFKQSALQIENLIKKELPFIMNKVEAYQEKYHSAENLLLEIMNMKWYQKLFLSAKIFNHFKQTSE